MEKLLLEAKKALKSESHLVLKEQQKNTRLETYLLRVASTQNGCSSAIKDEQKAILDWLRDITTKVDVIEKAATAERQPLQLAGLDECVRMVAELRDADRVLATDVAKVTDAMTTLSQRQVRIFQTLLHFAN